MDGSGLFVSSCSRRELARRRSAGRFWTPQNLRWLLTWFAGSGRRSARGVSGRGVRTRRDSH